MFSGFPVPNTMRTVVGIQATKGKMPKDRSQEGKIRRNLIRPIRGKDARIKRETA